MTEEKVYSTVKDENIRKNLNGSPIWKNCLHSDDLTSEIKKKYPNLIEYSIKFDGLKPVQVLKIK